MVTTSLNLGKHWDDFIQKKIETGQYESPSEILRDSLRLLEEREIRLESLRAELITGEESGSVGKLDMERIKQKAKLQVGLK